MKEEGINVLSLCNGISTGRLALENIGIKVNKYYTSEINKYASAITRYHYPDSIELGDMTKWRDWDIDWGSIDLVFSATSCQSFSVAGKGGGVKDPRGQLLYDLADILELMGEKNPDFKFLAENVKMKKEFEELFNEALGCEPVLLNSELVSAQKRARYFWSNIEDIPQPENKGILLKDIIEDGIVNRDKSFCIDTNYSKGSNLKSYFEKHRRQLVFIPPEKLNNQQYLKNYMQYDVNNKGHKSQDQRAYYLDSKHGCLDTGASSKAKILLGKDKVRKLTPVECERLQTLPDGYTEKGIFDGVEKEISNSQRYKCLGNGWTCAIIEHILKCIFKGRG